MKSTMGGHGFIPRHERAKNRCIEVGRAAYRAVLVEASAARIHGMWVLPPRKGKEPVTLALASGNVPARSAWPVGVEYRKMRLGGDHYRDYGQVRATTRPRTAVDIARRHGWMRGFVAFEWLLRQGVKKSSLVRYIDSLGRLKGIGYARRALDMASGLSESPYEALCFALLIHEKLGAPMQQINVLPGIRVDILVDGWLVIEVDGKVKYDGQTYSDDVRGVVVRERQREVRLQNAGYSVIRVISTEMFYNPSEFFDDVRQALAAGPPRGVVPVSWGGQAVGWG